MLTDKVTANLSQSPPFSFLKFFLLKILKLNMC